MKKHSKLGLIELWAYSLRAQNQTRTSTLGLDPAYCHLGARPGTLVRLPMQYLERKFSQSSIYWTHFVPVYFHYISVGFNWSFRLCKISPMHHFSWQNLLKSNVCNWSTQLNSENVQWINSVGEKGTIEYTGGSHY